MWLVCIVVLWENVFWGLLYGSNLSEHWEKSPHNHIPSLKSSFYNASNDCHQKQIHRAELWAPLDSKAFPTPPSSTEKKKNIQNLTTQCHFYYATTQILVVRIHPPWAPPCSPLTSVLLSVCGGPGHSGVSPSGYPFCTALWWHLKWLRRPEL